MMDEDDVEEEYLEEQLNMSPAAQDIEEAEEEEEHTEELIKSGKKRNKVGMGSITFMPADLKTIEGIVTDILKITNSSMTIINNKIDTLRHTEIRDADLERMSEKGLSYEMEDEGEIENERLVNEIKKDYILKNLMNTISGIPDRLNKICCVIYLMRKGAHITYREYFKLVPIKTEFTYINEDNEWINAVIENICQDVFKNTRELDDIVASFKQSIDPEMSSYLESKYTDLALVNMKTGPIYRNLKRHFGEKFTTEDQQIVSKFLSDFKTMKKKSIVRELPYYLDKFQITQSDWTTRMRDLRALKEVNQVSAFDWLSIY